MLLKKIISFATAAALAAGAVTFFGGFNGGLALARKDGKWYVLEATGYPKVGDKLGDALYTDIRAFINGAEARAYAIEGAIYVAVADLRYYGFNVDYDGGARTSTITFDKNKPFMPIGILPNKGEVGAPAFPYLKTDIKAVINGRQIEGRAVNGTIAIPFSALAPFGKYSYDNASRMCNLVITPKEE